jgi:hypothetical protein
LKTVVVKASDIERDVVQNIFHLRNPKAIAAWKKELAVYERERDLGGHTEVTLKMRGDDGVLRKLPGYYVLQDGVPFGVARPALSIPVAYGYTGYDRSFGFTTHAGDYGILADSLYNRNIRADRVDSYIKKMEAGHWHDLLSDPIAITKDGQVVNGQHRIAAAVHVDWSKVEHDPSFLVVWGVDQKEALHADGSRRTASDEKLIASKVLASV